MAENGNASSEPSKTPETLELRQNWIDTNLNQPIMYASAFALQVNPAAHEFTLCIGVADLPMRDTYGEVVAKLKEDGQVDVIPIVRVMLNPIRLSELHDLVAGALANYANVQQEEDDS